MKPGDRIVIIDKKHPWAGYTGKLISYGVCINPNGWLIELDGGHRVSANNNQIEEQKPMVQLRENYKPAPKTEG